MRGISAAPIGPEPARFGAVGGRMARISAPSPNHRRRPPPRHGRRDKDRRGSGIFLLRQARVTSRFRGRRKGAKGEMAKTLKKRIFDVIESPDPEDWKGKSFDDFMIVLIITNVIAVVLETSRRVLGIAIPIIATLFLLQLYYGPYLPGKLSHSGLPVDRIIEFSFSTQEAMFGVVTATFATFVFPFMIFGAFLERSGAGTFFMDLATALTGKWRGGPAKIAVVSSALLIPPNINSSLAFRLGFCPVIA
ncbi:MAG: TRAP transporter large permease subunit [Proteobacteria bacterium]|nr:TRAP transporter large permease subunit [Pseudomonadota bacterium]